MKYEWRENARTRGLDVENVAPVLEHLEQRHGHLTPAIVLREASKPRSPLHGWFVWDDTEAARLYRLDQARELIRSVTVTVVGEDAEELTVRAFVNLGGDASEYESIAAVMREPDKRKILLANARRDMETFRRKYHNLKAVAPVLEAIGAVLEAA